jgi:hypothetical protein
MFIETAKLIDQTIHDLEMAAQPIRANAQPTSAARRGRKRMV